MTPILLIVTLLFADGHQEKRTHEFKADAHARDFCQAREEVILDEIKDLKRRSLLTGHTMISCHLLGEQKKQLPASEEKTP